MVNFVKIVLFFCILLNFSTEAKAVDCKKHKIFCAIKKLRPSMDNAYAMKLSNSIYKYSKIYKLDPLRSIAIIMQETSIRNIDRKQKVIIFDTYCNPLGKCIEDYRIIQGSSDVSLFQFHVNTIEKYKIDPIKLKNDLDYATDWHFRILKKKISYCSNLGEDAWSCYHSTTPKFRKKYLKKVNKFYKMISGGM